MRILDNTESITKRIRDCSRLYAITYINWHSPKTVDKMMLKLMMGNLNAKSKIRSRVQAGGC